VTRVKS